ncbi:hypothetical protein B6N60_05066 [Richelia sinica FACHB-800]|uniref:DUF1802 domain-containing protein n=1 Tax=Richelia sinica FACHB-800 TaxID=1357546 RepID=A0A975TCP5_9NOST|nr:DUF1802 family protein [Richelia sinica]MBD2663937.1 DUF1802 family protein [Richelia sinica FACHB-800]QXE26335.1 hypothetical protein B6N60_05066 [Richelia sinica FACHB-800]
MSQVFSLPTALCLPVADIEALIQGRTIAALPNMFLRPGQKFALYPVAHTNLLIPIEKYYSQSFLPTAQTAIKSTNSQTVAVKMWGKCEFCQIIDKTKSLDVFSKLTIWTPEVFYALLEKQQNIFLAYLRVYHLPQFYEFTINPGSQDKLGRFIAIHNVTGSETQPILTEQRFKQYQRQLENLEPPLHPQLEELHNALSKISITNTVAQQLTHEIRVLLGWNSQYNQDRVDGDLIWIKKIAKVGNSSDGNEFEKLVRKSLVKIGFSASNMNSKANLDPEKLGGAGGLDFYCEYPYLVVGECKATKTEKVPDGTAAQLVKLGLKHLQQQYNSCIKIIMAAGELTTDAELTAKGNEMNVIRPETLQRLVEFKAKFPGAIDLLNLKPYLQNEPFGSAADDKINAYLNKIEQNIKLRSHIIQVVKNYLQNSGTESAGVAALHGAYFGSQPQQQLKPEEIHEILIELSSPLTGYLGREKGSDWTTDRFYYLRDLSIN